eukprot:1182417-Amorphochlora_amoeboformis.AAC.2
MAAAVIASEYSDLKSDGMSSSGKIHRSHSCEQVAKKKMDVAETMARLKLAGKSEYWWVSEKEIKFKSEKPKFGKLCKIQKAEWRSLTIAVKTLKEPIRSILQFRANSVPEAFTLHYTGTLRMR